MGLTLYEPIPIRCGPDPPLLAEVLLPAPPIPGAFLIIPCRTPLQRTCFSWQGGPRNTGAAALGDLNDLQVGNHAFHKERVHSIWAVL